MGLKEPGLRGSLRNVSVGIAAIPDDLIYDRGAGEDDFEVSFSRGEGTTEKRDESLFARVVGDASEQEERLWSTVEKVDLSDFNSIRFRSTGQAFDDLSTFWLAVDSTDANQRAFDWDQSVAVEEGVNDWTERDDSIDVSGLSGEYFVGFAVEDPSGSSSNEIEVDVFEIELVE